MAALPICDELRRSVGKSNCEPQFILRCHREISEDLRLEREINALCMRSTAIVDEREVFANELDMLAGKYVSDKMGEFTKHVQNKDIPNFMKLQIIRREFELKAQENELFIKKLKEGGVGSVVVVMAESSFFVGCTSEGWRGIVEIIVSAMVSSTSGGGVSTHMVILVSLSIFVLYTVVYYLTLRVKSMDRRPLITKLRYKADLSNWPDVLTYFCREAADEDRNIATKLNRLREEMLIIYEKRRNLVDELRSIRGIIVVQKAAEFVVDTVRKDNVQVAQLREVGCAHGMPMLQELAGAADSTEIKDQLSVLFRREVKEESQKMHDYRRLSDELRESFMMRYAYIEEFQRLQMYGCSDEVTESIEILKSMQVDDMEKASRLILMARDIQNIVYEKYNFIMKLRG
nr:hypothetical protein [Tanacetum cinerariifolium]